MTRLVLILVTAMAAHAPGAAAADGSAPLLRGLQGFEGETSFSANKSTGNSETTDLGAGFRFKRAINRWKHAGGLAYDYGVNDGRESKNRFFSNYQLDFTYNHRAFVFGRATYELDKFDGFDYRANVGAGFGYDLIQRDITEWSLQAGPAAQFNALEEVRDTETGEITTPGATDIEVAFGLGSRFSTVLNEGAKISNETDVTWTEETTLVLNSAALTTQLLGSLAARFGVDVAHDAEPPAGKKTTDTTTRASLIYTFGQ